VKAKLGDDVVKIGYMIGENSDGDTSIFFRILLPDVAREQSTLGEVTSKIWTIWFDELNPLKTMGRYLPRYRKQKATLTLDRAIPEVSPAPLPQSECLS
jgi:hypothetical protein